MSDTKKTSNWLSISQSINQSFNQSCLCIIKLIKTQTYLQRKIVYSISVIPTKTTRPILNIFKLLCRSLLLSFSQYLSYNSTHSSTWQFCLYV